MAECRYCAFARFGLHGSESLPHVAGCLLDLSVMPRSHDCPMFEREPGSDDDLGDETTDPLPVPIPAADQR